MKHLRLIITIALFISCALQSFAVDEYYLNKAESYRRDAEYYFEKAKGYERDAEYYSKRAQNYYREAEYYAKKQDYDRVKTYQN